MECQEGQSSKRLKQDEGTGGGESSFWAQLGTVKVHIDMHTLSHRRRRGPTMEANLQRWMAAVCPRGRCVKAIHEADVVVLGEDLKQYPHLLASLGPGQAALSLAWYTACVTAGGMVDPAPGHVLHGGCWLLAGQQVQQVQRGRPAISHNHHQPGMYPAHKLIEQQQQQQLLPPPSHLRTHRTSGSARVPASRQQLQPHSMELLTPCCSAPAPRRASGCIDSRSPAGHNNEAESQPAASTQTAPSTQPLQCSSMVGQVCSMGSPGGSVNGGCSCQGDEDEEKSMSSWDMSSMCVMAHSLLPGRYDLWAGRLAAGTDVELLMLQATYDKAQSERLGNERLVEAIKEIVKFEEAVSVESRNEGSEWRDTAWSRACASIRACRFTLTKSLTQAQLVQLLPHVGHRVAGTLHELIQTGTCAKLQAFLANQAVNGSQGVRHHTVGAATKRYFKRLPGVGARTAASWWDRGYRTYADVLDDEGLYLSAVQRHSLEYAEQLTADVQEHEVEEMKQAVLQALEQVSSLTGWELFQVGGSRRVKGAHHDADMIVTNSRPEALPFLVTDPHDPEPRVQPVAKLLSDHLASTGRLVPPGQGFHQLSATGVSPVVMALGPGGLAELYERPATSLAADKHHKLFAIFITSERHHRRMDLIFVVPQALPWGLLGWIGSKQYLRMLKQYTKTRLGIQVGVHGALRRCGANKFEWVEVESEEDIFAVFGLEYHTPEQRDA